MSNFVDATESVYIKEFTERGRSNFLNEDNIQQYGLYDSSSYIVPLENAFFYKYRTLLLENCETLVLNEKNYNIYKFRPKKFSYDFYGSVDYWYIILIINNIPRVSLFNLKEIKYIPFNKLSIIDDIINKESTNRVVKKIEILDI